MLFCITKGMPDHTHLKGLNKTATFLDAYPQAKEITTQIIFEMRLSYCLASLWA